MSERNAVRTGSNPPPAAVQGTCDQASRLKVAADLGCLFPWFEGPTERRAQPPVFEAREVLATQQALDLDVVITHALGAEPQQVPVSRSFQAIWQRVVPEPDRRAAASSPRGWSKPAQGSRTQAPKTMGRRSCP